MNVSRTIMRSVIKEGLGLKPYVKRTVPNLKEQHKMNRKSFGIWVRKSTVEKFYCLMRNIFNLMEFIISKTFEFMLLHMKKLTAKTVIIVKANILFGLWYS